jgi:probable HAF family extracellular repeat protein
MLVSPSTPEGRFAPLTNQHPRPVNAPSRIARRFLAGVFSAVVLAVALPQALAQTYTATALGSLGGGTAFGTGISNSGTIVGYSTLTSGAPTHAFKLSGGTMSDLGTLGGTNSLSNAINAGGTVVGRSDLNSTVTYAILDSGTMTSLGSLGGSFSEANNINVAGTVVGDSLLADEVTSNAFSYSGGTISNLGTLGGPTSYAYGINSYGTIVGRADYGSASTAHHGFSYANGVMTDLGSLAGTSSNAYAINDSGTIVGYSATTTGGAVFHAVTYVNGVVTDLGSLGGGSNSSRATGINNWGNIVGFYTNSGLNEVGFIVVGGVMEDLTSLVTSGLPGGVTLDKPAINDLGQMVANGSDNKAYLLKPVAGAATHLGVEAAVTVVPGTTLPVTVFALDANNNAVSGYAGTVKITSTDPAAGLPSNGMLASGVGTFLVKLNTNGSQTITATDTVTGTITGVSLPVAVMPTPTPTPPPTPTPTPTPQPARLVNLSARANVGTGGNVLIAGFVINGSGSKSVLLRGVGPTLSLTPFNVSGALAKPQLTLVNSATMATVATNTVWGGGATLSNAFAAVAAFPLATTSADSAILQVLPAGSYTSTVAGVSSTTGVALAEIYDEDAQPASTTLVNISARANVGTGANVLIAGFVVEGAQSATLLLRGIGPTLGLAPFNLAGALSQPQIILYNSAGAELGGSQGWGGSAALSAAFTKVGAFALPAGSADAAMIATLPPGSYTVQLSGQNGTTGVGLVEVYLIPQ